MKKIVFLIVFFLTLGLNVFSQDSGIIRELSGIVEIKRGNVDFRIK